jgi:hypothetical protein
VHNKHTRPNEAQQTSNKTHNIPPMRPSNTNGRVNLNPIKGVAPTRPSNTKWEGHPSAGVAPMRPSNTKWEGQSRSDGTGGGPPPGDPQIQNGRVRCGSGEGGHRKLDNDGLTGIRSKGSPPLQATLQYKWEGQFINDRRASSSAMDARDRQDPQ